MKIGKISFEKSVGAVVFRKEEDEVFFLLLHYISGHWDFPKGHVEEGESEHETLRREVQEETGIRDLEIILGFKKNIFYSYRPGGKEREKKKGVAHIIKKVVYYAAETESVEIGLSHEHKGFEWLPYDEAIGRITHDNGKNILLKANIFLKKKK